MEAIFMISQLMTQLNNRTRLEKYLGGDYTAGWS